ncbi:MAG TPA: S1/P1 nuclease [Vicinamibacteria bacterium]|nr:S1/P1 nuclease [Vicinamibacteria bacterium]
MGRHTPRPWIALVGLAMAGTVAPAASGWGPTGHRAVGRIAEKHLDPRAARVVADLLAPEQLAYVTTWADDIRAEPAWAVAETWHWVTIPDGESYEATRKNPTGDILEAIARFEKALAAPDTPRLERAQALKWLSHLVGDLHQPLHVGRGDDRGGNETVVLWFGEPTNLHSVWDAKLIESSQLSFSELAALLDHATPEQVREWQASAASEWARESQALRGACYELGDRRLSYGYAHEHWPTVARRVLQAGVRLAGELNRLLGAR